MWKDYFSFNKRQRNGIIVLLVLIIGMMGYLLIADYFPPAPVNIDVASFKADVVKAKLTSDSASAGLSVSRENKVSSTVAIELNSADSADLSTLPQITPKIARTIIHFRDALGGYYSKIQLLEVYGLDTACYNAIVNKVTLNSTKVEKLDINHATEKDLTRHPYIHKKLAKAIYDYRKINGPFSKTKDILKVEGVDEDKYAKLAPYITIDK